MSLKVQQYKLKQKLNVNREIKKNEKNPTTLGQFQKIVPYKYLEYQEKTKHIEQKKYLKVQCLRTF